MQDSRIDRLAGVITDYSTAVKRGDIVLITASGEECQPLLKAVHRSCIERGARHVEIQFSFPEITGGTRFLPAYCACISVHEEYHRLVKSEMVPDFRAGVVTHQVE